MLLLFCQETQSYSLRALGHGLAWKLMPCHLKQTGMSMQLMTESKKPAGFKKILHYWHMLMYQLSIPCRVHREVRERSVSD